MNRYEKVNHTNAKIIVLVCMFISFIAFIGFGYLYFNDINSRPLVTYPNYSVSTSNWTNQNIIVTVNNKNAKFYSIDGGVTFQEDNKFEISENGEYSLVVKDINDRLSNTVIIRINKIDKDAPIVDFESPTRIKINSVFYPRSGVSISDGDGSGVMENYRIEPSTIDTKVPGTYQIKYTVSDQVGNITTKVRTIIVE